MKLRYQMRGLGIGILVTALLMGVATKEGRPLTDAEIRAKAYELGMVDGDSLRLSDFKGSTPKPQVTETASPQGTQPPEGTAAPQGTQPPEGTASPQGTQPPEGTASPQGTQPPEGTASPQGTQPPEGTASPQGTTAPEETTMPDAARLPQESAAPVTEPEGGGSEEAVTVVVMRGTHSYSVSVQLAEAGLIEDAEEFDSYLCNNGYGGKVRAGIYRIVPGTSEEQIARIITGTK